MLVQFRRVVSRHFHQLVVQQQPAAWWQLVGWFLLGLIVLNLSLSPILGLETDIWWHLAGGQRLWLHGLELSDPYSFTAAGHPWVRIDWLFQALVYALFQWGGLTALILARSACLLTGTAVLAFILRRRALMVSWLLALLVISIWAQSISLRPATPSLLLTAVWVAILEEARRGKSSRLWLLPPLMVFWFNLHVASLAGILLLGLYALGYLLESLHARRPLERAWLLAPPLCFLATFLNPQTWQAVWYPIHFLLVKSPWREVILEVQPPSWGTPGTTSARLLLALSLIGALQALRRREFTPLLVTLVCGFLMNRVCRHQYQLCSALLPWAALALNRPATLLAWGGGALLALQAAVALLFLRWPLTGLVRRESFSERLVAQLSQGPAGLRVFTDMNAGGYFLYHFDGRQKVFIDSRSDQVYLQPNIVAEYYEIWLGRKYAMALLDRYQVQAVANNRVSSAGSPLFAQLKSSPQWICVTSDMIGELYVRKELADQFPEKPMPAYLRDFLDAFPLQAQGRVQQAEALWQRSLRDYPEFASAYQWLGRLWMTQGKYAQARQALARAEFFHPGNPGLDEDWQHLGMTWPGWVRSYFLPFWAIWP